MNYNNQSNKKNPIGTEIVSRYLKNILESIDLQKTLGYKPNLQSKPPCIHFAAVTTQVVCPINEEPNYILVRKETYENHTRDFVVGCDISKEGRVTRCGFCFGSDLTFYPHQAGTRYPNPQSACYGIEFYKLKDISTLPKNIMELAIYKNDKLNKLINKIQNTID